MGAFSSLFRRLKKYLIYRRGTKIKQNCNINTARFIFVLYSCVCVVQCVKGSVRVEKNGYI